MTKPGTVVWITGLSGTGKTTFAGELTEKLRSQGEHPVHLDGDEVRAIFSNDLGHGEADRLANAYRICRVAKLLSEQGLTVVCSTMSLFPEIWEWNRANFKSYLEVLLKAPLDDLKRRNNKGIYTKTATEDKTVVGLNITYIEPPAPDILINNSFQGKSAWLPAMEDLIRRIKSAN